jgi:hypothetical protein
MFHVEPSPPQAERPLLAFDLGYVMGLVVGEGSFTGDKRVPVLAVKMHQRDPEPLRFLLAVLGGKIYGPYHHDGRHFLQWHLRGVQLRRAVPIFLDHLPPSHKRRQFLAWGVR